MRSHMVSQRKTKREKGTGVNYPPQPLLQPQLAPQPQFPPQQDILILIKEDSEMIWEIEEMGDDEEEWGRFIAEGLRGGGDPPYTWQGGGLKTRPTPAPTIPLSTYPSKSILLFCWNLECRNSIAIQFSSSKSQLHYFILFYFDKSEHTRRSSFSVANFEFLCKN